MRKLLLALIGVFALALPGCVPSLYPLYTTKDLRFDQALLGIWAEDDEPNDTWTFSKQDAMTYRLEIRESNRSAPFEARLVELGKQRFLDIYPHEDGLDDAKIADIYKMSLIPGHLFLRISQIEPILQMAFLDNDWLKAKLSENPNLLAHQQRGNNDFVITATTRELQVFMQKYGAEKDAFGDYSQLKRRK